VAVRFVPYTSRETAEALAFNQRMREANSGSDFLLPEEPPEPAASDSAIKAVYYLALEKENDEEKVRGGFVLGDYPAWLNSNPITATVCIAPLSEGIIDPKYSMLSMHFVRYHRTHNPYGFASGMGSPSNAYPRLLKAAGWSIFEIPFYFRVCRASRFLRQIGALRSSRVRQVGSSLAAWSGIGAIGAAAAHSKGLLVRGQAAGLSAEVVTEWSSWIDEIWDRVRASFSFAIRRDVSTLKDLYPASETRVKRLLVRRGDHVVGWGTTLDTQMKSDKYFGNLRVATILDCIAPPSDLTAVVYTVSRALQQGGADLIISNQSHSLWQEAFRRSGFLQAPSNYCLGISKPIADAIGSGDGASRIYFTRGDGDGRMHL
jgi:hypothetical protein